MGEITKMRAIEARSIESNGSLRKCFAQYTGIQENKEKPTFSFSKRIPGLRRLFEEMTGLRLIENGPNFYCFLQNDDIDRIKRWEAEQGTTIFIGDTLFASIALDFNLIDNHSGTYTPLGRLEHDAKTDRNVEAIDELVNLAASRIKALPFYKDADFVCAIPAAPNKDFDLPTVIAKKISLRLSIDAITSGFIFGQNKSTSVKSTPMPDKWAVWENTGLCYNNNNETGIDIKGKNVILIDDKYQSGMTIQFVAMKLQEAGANNIYGLCMVKTLRDTDNQ